MGRSGSSLLSSYLVECGINMGDALKGPGVGNPLGHFEDMGFLEFHKSLLRDRHSDFYTPKDRMTFTEKDKEFAERLVDDRNTNHPVWGWKDPRTTLFLDDWVAIDEKIRFLFLYRSPFAVIESVYKATYKFNLFFRPWVGPASWLHYNKLVLKFMAKHPDKCILVNIDGIIKGDGTEALKRISNWLKIDLNKPFGSVYKPDVMTAGKGNKPRFPIDLYIRIIKRTMNDKLMRTFNQLEQHALIPGPDFAKSAPTRPTQ
jgi:hypothetical protein